MCLRIHPATQGTPRDVSKEGRNRVTFKEPGNGGFEMTVTGFDWVVGPRTEMSNLGPEQCLD
jgi:hypothetical protein